METLDIVTNTRETLKNLFPMSAENEEIVHTSGMFDRWYDGYASFREIFPLSQLKQKFDDREVDNFVYHKESGLVFSTLNSADHSDFMSGLYSLHHLKEGREIVFDADTHKGYLTRLYCHGWDGQDNYLYECLGMYQSSCGPDVYRHTRYEMNAAEYDIFRTFRSHIYDWSAPA